VREPRFHSHEAWSRALALGTFDSYPTVTGANVSERRGMRAQRNPLEQAIFGTSANASKFIAPPLHGGGRGFESHRLHSEIPGFAGKTRGMDRGRRTNLGPRTATDTVTRLSRCVARYAAGAVTIGAEPPRIEAINGCPHQRADCHTGRAQLRPRRLLCDRLRLGAPTFRMDPQSGVEHGWRVLSALWHRLLLMYVARAGLRRSRRRCRAATRRHRSGGSRPSCRCGAARPALRP
jgi:hypothetical protein